MILIVEKDENDGDSVEIVIFCWLKWASIFFAVLLLMPVSNTLLRNNVKNLEKSIINFFRIENNIAKKGSLSLSMLL